MSEEIKKSNTEVVKCATCGADMVFDTASGKLKCPYCATTAEIENNRMLSETDFKTFDESKFARDDTSIVYRCPNCHAETVMRELGASEKCPFCGATNIIAKDAIPGMKPDSILPFVITKDVAVASSLKWIKKKIFAPSKLKKAFNINEMNGIYEPTFTFTSDTTSRYDGKFGETYTVTVGSGKNRRTEVRTRWYPVSGVYNRTFTDIVVESSPHLNQSQMDKIGPFDTVNAVNYKSEYLAGFLAERYDTGVRDCFGVAQNKIDKAIRQEIIAKYNPDRIDYLNINTNHNRITFKHLLLPMYSCFYKYKAKIYNFFINGRTAKVSGKTPLSPFRVAFAVVLGAGIIVLAAYLMIKSGIIKI